MTTTSLTLLDAVKGDPRSPEWTRFTRLYTPLLERWARRNGFRPADAEDLAQEVLRQLVTSLPGYQRQEGKTFRSWLFAIARNTAVRIRTRPATRLLPGADGLSGVEGDPAFVDVEEQEYAQELGRRALEAVQGDFNEQTLAAFRGTQLDGRPAGEVAAELGVTANTVYLAVHRVMTRLRKELDGLLD